MRLTKFDQLKKAHLDYKDWILKFRLTLSRVKDAWMDLNDIVDLRTTVPFDATAFRKRWDIMIAWKTFRQRQDPTDPLLDKWEAEN